MTVVFDTIPNNMLVPGVYTETSTRRAAASGNNDVPKRIVVAMQKLTAGIAVAGTLFRVTGEADADRQAGVGSMLSEALKVVKATNRYIELYGVAVADGPSATAASATVTFTATTPGIAAILLYVSPYWVNGSTLRGRYSVPCNASSTATSLATAAAAAINADPYRQVNATSSAGVLTLTARSPGIAGNSLVVVHSFMDGEALPTGVTCVPTAFTGGTVNPDMSAAVAALGDLHATQLVHAYVDSTSLTATENEMTRRWGGTVQRECHLFTGARGTLSALITLGDGRNSEFSTIFGTGLSPTPPWIAAANLAAVDASMGHPGQSLQGKQLFSMVAPAMGMEFIGDERNQLLAEGISTYTVQGGKVFVEREVTTYQKDQNGNPDSLWRDRQIAGLLFTLRYDWRVFFGGKYAGYMHSANGTAVDPGVPVITPSTVAAEAEGRAGIWERSGFIENAAQFIADLYIERLEEGMDAIFVPDLINRLHVMRTRFDFLR